MTLPVGLPPSQHPLAHPKITLSPFLRYACAHLVPALSLSPSFSMPSARLKQKHRRGLPAFRGRPVFPWLFSLLHPRSLKRVNHYLHCLRPFLFSSLFFTCRNRSIDCYSSPGYSHPSPRNRNYSSYLRKEFAKKNRRAPAEAGAGRNAHATEEKSPPSRTATERAAGAPLRGAAFQDRRTLRLPRRLRRDARRSR